MKNLTRLGFALAVAPLLALSAPAELAAQQAEAVGATATVTQTVPADTRAQQPATDSSNVRAATAAVGPVASGVALQMRTTHTNAPAPVPQMSRSNATAMMVVGLAAVVTGIAVGDDAGTILVLGGAGIGLYGLYKFMQ